MKTIRLLTGFPFPYGIGNYYTKVVNREIDELYTFSGLGIKTASYPTKCKQTPPSWNEKRMFLFITFFVGND
jgi:hypothetical protein